MKKKLISFVLVLAVIISVLPTTFTNIFAADSGNKCGENLTWSLDSTTGVLTISGSGAMDDYTAGKAPWYSERMSIKTVVIDKFVESIGSFAFYNCSNLKKVVIKDADSFKAIGTKAFYYSTQLTTVVYCGEEAEWNAVVKGASWDYRTSAKVKYHNIVDSVCTECGYSTKPANIVEGTCGDGLTWVLDLDTNVLTISGNGAMTDFASGKAPWHAKRSSIKTLVIEKGVESIGSFAFYNCASLTKVVIKNGTTLNKIGTKAFYYATALKTIIYCGTEVKWDAVTKEANWDSKTSATINFHNYVNDVCTECGGVNKPEETTATVTFVANGDIVGTVTYEVGDTDIVEPAVPAKAHYTGCWASYVLNGDDITVEAIYTPIEYIVTFFGDGIWNTVTYTIEDTLITEPVVPTKNGYAGVWEAYSLEYTNDQIVYAVYTPIDYTVTFVADGITVGTVTYNVENYNIVAPEVPYKSGYTGAWEPYVLDMGDKVVKAVYTASHATIAVGNEAVEVGNTVDVVLTLEGNPGISGLIVTIKYDKTALKLVKVTNGTVMSTMTSGTNIVFNNTPDSAVDGTLVTLTFEALDSALAGDYDIECVVRECSNDALQPVDIVATNGTVTIKDRRCGDNLTWAFDAATGTLTISGTGDMYDYDVVTTPWYNHRDSITAVIIEEGVTSIGTHAFSHCGNLASVTFEGNSQLTKIGAYAFYLCKELVSVTIPASVENIGNWAFAYCSKLESVNFEAGSELASIGANAFAWSESLTRIVYCGTESEWDAVNKAMYWNINVPAEVQFHDFEGGVCVECGYVCTHDWEDVEITLDPTHTTEGEKKIECTVCGMTDTEVLPVLPDHEFGDWAEYDDEQHVRYCECGEEEYEDHNFKSGSCLECGAKDAALIFEIESAEIYLGSTVDIAVNVISNPGIQGMILTVEYDTNALILTSVSNGTIMNTLTYGVNIVLDNNADTDSIGTLVVLTFATVDGADAGDYEISCRVRECYNSAFEGVNTVLINGKITVSDAFVFGDADGNGLVNLNDSILIKTYLANYDYDTATSTVKVMKGADANGDGRINLKDALLVNQYLASYDYDTGSSSVVLGPVM